MAFQTPIIIKTTLERMQRHEYVLPAIQREFVWGTDQICALFDSLMKGYPIGSFLFWQVDPRHAGEYAYYDFIQHFHELKAPHSPRLDLPPGHGHIAIPSGRCAAGSPPGACRPSRYHSARDDQRTHAAPHRSLARPGGGGHGLDLISATDGSSVQSYFSYGGLGSTTDLTDGAGAVTDAYSYDVFGAIRSSSGSSANVWLFTGEQRDLTAGGGSEQLPLDTVVSSVNLTGATVANLDDDPDAPDADRGRFRSSETCYV